MAKPIFNEKTKTWSIRATIIDDKGIRHREQKGGFFTAEAAIEWEKQFHETNTINNSLLIFDIFSKMMWEKEFKQHLKLKTLSSYEQNISYLRKDLPNISIQDLTPKHIEKALNKNLNFPRKCYWYKQLLSMVVNFAKANKYVTESFNPFEGITWVDYKSKEKPYIYSEDLKSFLTYCKENHPQLYAPILLCGTYGLRPSEAICLEYSDINNNTLNVYKTFEEAKRKKQLIKNTREDTKNGLSGEYYIDGDFVEELKYFSNLNSIKSNYICCNTVGEMMSLRQFELQLKKTLDKYNQQPNVNKLPALTPYSFRHSFGNIAKRNGENLYTIKDLMRHKSIRTTEKNYLRSDSVLNTEATKKITNTLLNKPKQKSFISILDILD